MSKNPRIMAGKFLSEALRNLASEAHDIGESSEIRTRAQCLAKIVWDHALGFTKLVQNKEGKSVEQKVEPRVWAISLIFDRLEGRVPMSEDGTSEKVTLADRVDKISKKSFEELEKE